MAEDDEDPVEAPFETRRIELPDTLAGQRLDKAIAAAVPDISRARLKVLIEGGRLRRGDAEARDPSAKAKAGAYELMIPPPEPAEPEPQASEQARVLGVDGRGSLPQSDGGG